MFGSNSGNITNSTLTNSGIVTGGGIVGGLIGNNSGNISTSSLINKAGATVIGTNNVGGLIGINTGIITGGRTETDGTDVGYYKYQIYNNGVINVGTWNDQNNNGIVDAGEIKGISEGVTSENIGGLIGKNDVGGTLTAGYNTGAINAAGSTNVGGIAGSNSGTIDQVFNTVMVAQGSTQNAAITGGTNVGGLVGNNDTNGTLTNAYNTTAVNGDTSVGNAVGTNSGTISSVFDVTNENNKLVGFNDADNGGTIEDSYTSAIAEVGSTDDSNGITYIFSDNKNDKESYTSLTDDSTWKFYDGNQTPLLSVFLTDVSIKVDFDKINEYINNVYNGNAQAITDDDIDKLIAEGAITAPDNFTAYKNAKDLIESMSHTNAGKYSDWLYSGQIAQGSQDGSFNPNNLGYDIELTTSIAQAELSISDILANIVYGENTYTDITGGSLTGTIYNSDEVYLTINGTKVDITSDFIKQYLSETYKNAQNNRNTADVKRDQDNNVVAYENAISVGDITLSGGAAGNYKLANPEISGDITVTPASLNITLNDIYRIYGDRDTIYGNYEATQGGNYGIKDVTGLVNGDNLSNLVVTATSDGALDNFTNPKKTSDVKEDGYKWSGDFSGIDNVNSNYNITVDGGKSFVKAKTITIKDLLATIVYGNQGNKGLQIKTDASLADGSIVYGDSVTLGGTAIYETTGTYNENKGNRDTADVGTYTNSLKVSGLELVGTKSGNYILDTTSAVGDIEVTKADLTINVNDATTVYGDAFTDADYSHTLTGVTNGDSYNSIDELLGGNYSNGVSVEAGKNTNNVDTYKDKLDFISYNDLKNYNVKVEQGDVIITKADLNVKADDITTTIGVMPNFTGTDIQQGLVNGDNADMYEFNTDVDIDVVGSGQIGIIFANGKLVYNLEDTDWSQVTGWEFLSNYNITFEPGTLTVTDQVLPDLPDNWPSNRWDYLFNDNPFDRNKNFRERKAEVNFVDGGMEI